MVVGSPQIALTYSAKQPDLTDCDSTNSRCTNSRRRTAGAVQINMLRLYSSKLAQQHDGNAASAYYSAGYINRGGANYMHIPENGLYSCPHTDRLCYRYALQLITPFLGEH